MRKQIGYIIAAMALAAVLARDVSPVKAKPTSSVVVTDADGAVLPENDGGYLPTMQDVEPPAADPKLTPDLAEQMIYETVQDAGENLSPQAAFADPLPAAYPAGYDQTEMLKNYLSNRMMPTRNQSPYGSCWAHAAISSLELYRNRMQNVPISVDDLSEYHLVHFTYGEGSTQTVSKENTGDSYVFDGTQLSEDQVKSYGLEGQDLRDLTPAQKDVVFLDRGGNATDAGHALMHWKGAAAESDAPYPRVSVKADPISEPSAGWEAVEYKDAARMENQYRISLESNPDLVKRFVREYGGIQTGYYHAATGLKATDLETGEVIYDDTDGPGYFNAGHCSYNLPHVKGTNHAVTLVGWDDDFPREYFNYPPEHNGAWLLRNSWNITDQGDVSESTYFWISYEDQTLNDTAYVYTVQEEKDRLDHNYYYDASMHASGGYPNSESARRLAANVFVAGGAKEQEVLSAVTLQETHSGSKLTAYADGGVGYEIRIYKDLESDDLPDQGTLAYTQTGTLPFSGMYTISLSEGVILDRGERFSVVIELDDGKITPDVEYSFSDGYMRSDVGCGAKGQSFYGTQMEGSDAYSWEDHWESGSGNFCIGAQTLEIPTLSVVRSGSSITIGWSAPADAQGYELRSASAPDGTYETVFSTNDPADCEFSGAVSDLGDRYYRIFRRVAGVTNERSGSAPIYISLEEETQSLNMTADKLNVSLPSPQAIYDGESHGAAATGPADYHGNLRICYQRIKDAAGEKVTGEGMTYAAPCRAGTYQVYISASDCGRYFGAKNLTEEEWFFTIAPKKITEQNTVVTWEGTCVYNGKEHSFNECKQVSCDGVVLALGNDKDFRVTYKAPTGRINAGTITYTLHGLGNYTGKISVLQTIQPMPLNGGQVLFSESLQFSYDGTQKTPQPVVTLDGGALSENEDYTVTYADNIHATSEGSKARCIVTGKGNYTGTLEGTFEIGKQRLRVKAVDLEKAVGTADPEFEVEFDGAANGEIPAFTGEMIRESGEESGRQYAILQGTCQIADRAGDAQGEGGFCSADYVMQFEEGTLSIKDRVLRTVTLCDPLAPKGSDILGVVTVDDAKTLASLQTFAKEGYTVAGWMMEVDGETQPFDLSAPIRRDLTLMAVWECSHAERFREIRGAKAASSTEAGYSGDVYCSLCGRLIQKGQLLSMEEKNPENPGGDGKDTGGKNGDASELEILGYIDLGDGCVRYEKCTDQNRKAVKIPDSITVNGRTYTVTEIGKSAFAGCKKVTFVTIGKNVKKIGKKAFYGCKKLKKITIRTTLLNGKRIGTKAFSGIAKKATFRLPKKKHKAYKKILLKKGATLSMKFLPAK